jgi:hypothetical protein
LRRGTQAEVLRGVLYCLPLVVAIGGSLHCQGISRAAVEANPGRRCSRE